MERPLGNSLVLKADQEAQNKANSQQQEDRTTEASPLLTLRPSFRTIQTPQRSQEVHKLLGSQVGELQQLYRGNPAARVTFSKIAKSLDDKAVKIAEYEQKIQALEAEVERLRPKKRRRVQMDLNERFARIEEIIKAKKAAGKVAMPDAVANSLIFEDMCFEWAVSDPVVDSEVKGVGDLDSDGSVEN